MKQVQTGSVAAAAMAAAFVVVLSMPARAADVTPAATSPSILTPAPSTEWTVTIGVEGRVMPKFEGSDSAMFRPLPILRVRRADKPDQFRAARDGLSVAILDVGQFKLGPTASFRFGRKESDDSSLRGLGDV
ncbi:MAG: MipA/OmpV family protein, partial [Pseudolabrys sp.]|nr:MipA/OmpV family protein [Pseudolabrys sp.]